MLLCIPHACTRQAALQRQLSCKTGPAHTQLITSWKAIVLLFLLPLFLLLLLLFVLHGPACTLIHACLKSCTIVLFVVHHKFTNHPPFPPLQPFLSSHSHAPLSLCQRLGEFAAAGDLWGGWGLPDAPSSALRPSPSAILRVHSDARGS